MLPNSNSIILWMYTALWTRVALSQYWLRLPTWPHIIALTEEESSLHDVSQTHSLGKRVFHGKWRILYRKHQNNHTVLVMLFLPLIFLSPEASETVCGRLAIFCLTSASLEAESTKPFISFNISSFYGINMNRCSANGVLYYSTPLPIFKK